MDQQFAIAGYTGSSCLMCAIDGADIWQVDYFGNRQQLIGKTAAAYTELEGTTQQYYDKLVELGVITPPKTQEELMGEMQSAMSDMAEIIDPNIANSLYARYGKTMQAKALCGLLGTTPEALRSDANKILGGAQNGSQPPQKGKAGGFTKFPRLK